jgi:hypothetical protein
MSKAVDKESRSHIGLATEHRLPAAFKAKTDDAAGTIQIRKENGRSVDVAINSFASVANFLAIFCPDGEPTLEPGHTIKIVDEFNDRSTTITANALTDAAAVMRAFAVARGKYIPSGPDQQTEEAGTAKIAAVAKVEQISSADEVAEEVEEEQAAAPAVAEEAPSTPASQPSVSTASSEEAPTKPKRGRKPKATVAPVNLDLSWTKDLPREYVDADGNFRLEAKTLALPKAKARVTLGVSDGSAEVEAFGYEVTDGTKPGGAHLGYIIVEDPKSWVVTGFGDMPATKHANLPAATIRIRLTNLPHLRGA